MGSGAKYTMIEENERLKEKERIERMKKEYGYKNLIFRHSDFHDIKKLVNPSTREYLQFSKCGVSSGAIRIVFSHVYMRELQSAIYDLYKFIDKFYDNENMRKIFERYFKFTMRADESNMYKIVNEPKTCFCDGYYGPKTYTEMRILLDIIIYNFEFKIKNKDKLDISKPYLSFGDVVTISYAADCIRELHKQIEDMMKSDIDYIIHLSEEVLSNFKDLHSDKPEKSTTKEYHRLGDIYDSFEFNGKKYDVKYMDLPYPQNEEFSMNSFMAGIQYYETHILNQN